MDIDITVSERKTLLSLLDAFLPGIPVWAFGSRVKFTSKPESDLDLVVFLQPGQESQLAELKEAFAESELPFKVDILDWGAIPENFRKNIEENHVVLQNQKSGHIPQNWKQCKLGDICTDISYGYTESSTNQPIGPKFLRITDIQNEFIDWNRVPYCPISKENYKKYKLKFGDIVIARTGASTGTTAIYKDEKIDAVFASYLIRYQINKKDADPFYIGHLLKSNMWNGYVSSIIGGSAQPGANAKQFANFNFLLPTIKDQHFISSILNSITEKIELNLQMNRTLENMAQNVFKEWFVNFNFPGFDGELVNGLPKGWKRGRLGQILDLNYGKALKAENRVSGIYPVVGSGGAVDYHNEYFVRGPGIVIGRKGTIGEVSWINKNFYPIDTTFFITDTLDVGALYFHYFLLKEYKFGVISTDSAVPGLNRNHAIDSRAIIPSVDLVKQFSLLVEPLFRKKKEIVEQNETLLEIRDKLLPRLMTGKIRISA